MSILNYFLPKRNKNSASMAKDRLQILLKHERSSSNESPDFLPRLQQELLAVIRRYVAVDDSQVAVQLSNGDEENVSILAVSIELTSASGPSRP